MEINKAELLSEEVKKQLDKEFNKRPWYSSKLDFDFDALSKIDKKSGEGHVPIEEVFYVMNEYMSQLRRVAEYKNDLPKLANKIHLCPAADRIEEEWDTDQFLTILEKHIFFESTGEEGPWDFFHDKFYKLESKVSYSKVPRIHGIRRLFPYCRYADSKRIKRVIDRINEAEAANYNKVFSVETVCCALLLNDTEEAINYLKAKKMLGYYASIRGKTEEDYYALLSNNGTLGFDL